MHAAMQEWAMSEIMLAIGLMSGTSLDGIDVAVLRSDGQSVNEPLFARTYDYDPELREQIRACFGLRDEFDPRLGKAEIALTRAHAAACKEALSAFPGVQLIGFHGQTIWHAPQEGRTRQLGSGSLLADLTKRPVVYDFRSNDMRAGGQGAPLLPLYHAARAQRLPRPLAVVNIGGVGNVTWIGENESDILSFDTGPGNALVNDWMESHIGTALDENGHHAAQGKADEIWLKEQLAQKYFKTAPPKSLDRDAFTTPTDRNWSLEDGAATLTQFTARSIAGAQHFFPQPPQAWIITGGGRHNKTMMNQLSSFVMGRVLSAETVGWNGDALEAEGFAFLAVRSFKRLPLTLPQTTGCAMPTLGGVIVQPHLATA